MESRSMDRSIYNINLVKKSLRIFSNFANEESIEGANEFAKENIQNIKKIDYSRFDLQTANEYNKHALILFELYPQIRFNYLGIGQDDLFRNLQLRKLFEDEFGTKHSYVGKISSKYDAMLKKSYEESMKSINKKYNDDYIGKVMDQSHGKYEGIWINPNYAESRYKLLQEVRNLISYKQAPKIEECTEYILTHEFGHLVLDFLTNDWCEETFVDELWNYLNKKYDINLKDFLKENLSLYAFKNKSEFFCEAFSEFIHSNKPRKLAQLVGKELANAIKFRKQVEKI